MDVRVGIDFGTHQTKVCTNYQKGNHPQVFEFINFGTSSDQDFFLPSRLNINKDGKVSVGHPKVDTIKSYRYFKIASAEDEEFKGVSGFKTNDTIYELDRYDDLSPELISIIYLIHVIGFIKEDFISRHKTIKKQIKEKSFMGKFFGGSGGDGQPEEDKFDFYFQIGIPTEWSAVKNRWRKRKFEQILYLAVDIIQVQSYKDIKEMDLHQLKSIIVYHYQALQQEKETHSWETLLNVYDISAFPETAAGLTYLVKTEKIGEGYYLALDIGGGSSDVSFFRVNSNRTFEYLASESLLIASNNLYEAYSKKSDNLESTEQAQEYLESQTKWEFDRDNLYRKAFNETIKRLNKRIYKIYNHRVYRRFRETVANAKFENQSCFLYGGGSLLHIPKNNPKHYFNKILLHDNGTQSLTGTRTYAAVEKITELDLVQDVKPDGWKKYLPLLIVPLGLSFIQPDQAYEWNNDFYKSGEGFNYVDEDPGLFDLFRRRWV